MRGMSALNLFAEALSFVYTPTTTEARRGNKGSSVGKQTIER